MGPFDAVRVLNKFIHLADYTGPEPKAGVDRRRTPFVTNTFFVDPQTGSAGADGRDPRRPISTVAAAIAKAHAGDTIYLVGNITEEVTVGPELEDLSFIGVARRPRHADHSRDSLFSSNQGCSWRQAASHGATTPLLKLRAQGIYFENILFVPPSDAAAIYLDRNNLSGTSEFDPSHMWVKGCRFVGGQSGIEDSGGCFNVRIEDCDFQQSTDGIKQLNSGTDVMTQWVLLDNRFELCTHAIRVSAKRWAIKGNIFGTFGSAPNIDLSFIAGNDALEVGNTLFLNQLAGTYNNTNYIEGAGNTDEWGGNGNVIAGGWTAAQP